MTEEKKAPGKKESEDVVVLDQKEKSKINFKSSVQNQNTAVYVAIAVVVATILLILFCCCCSWWLPSGGWYDYTYWY